MRAWWPALVVLLLAALLRGAGLSFGQPNAERSPTFSQRDQLHELTVLHPDEFLFVSIPWRMALSRRPATDFYENPNFLINLNFFTFLFTRGDGGISHAERLATSTNQRTYAPFDLYVVGRVFSAWGGVLGVAAAYGLARRLTTPYGAFVAALLVACAFPLVQHGHYSTTSSLAAGLGMACLWATAVAWERRSLRWMALAAFFGGLALGNRYNAALFVAPLGLACLALSWQERAWRWWLVPLLVPLVFLLTTPSLLAQPEKFIADLQYISNQYLGSGNPGGLNFSAWQGLGVMLDYLIVYGLGWPAALLALLSLLALRGPARLGVAALWGYAATYGLVFLRTVRPAGADQLTILIVPVLALLAGAGAGLLRTRWRRAWVGISLALAAVVVPLSLSLPFVARLGLPDTRDLMQDWVYNHVPRGARVAQIGPYNVPLDPQDYAFAIHYINPDDVTTQQVAEADYALVSDTQSDFVRRINPAYPRGLYVSWPVLAWIERPAQAGGQHMVHTASYWHNPGLTLYCLAACAIAP
ncbi:MAG: glycosyltransferase family 39 protein [Anaerolineae bacterium]|nr:glycosyltransferase family 39 protein [Anaerolineae bacterium]